MGALGAYRPFVSVIVPVFNDAERLRQCLAALEAQSYPRQQYEVIVVDNGSDPRVDLGAGAPNTILVVEPHPGSYAARNAGIARSRGEVLAFTDSDCLPSGDWLAKAVESLGRVGGDGIVAGGVEQSTPGRPPFSLAELYATTFWLRQEHYAKVLGLGVTANLVAHARLFKSVGLFDSALKSGGDHEWGRRARGRGVRFRYAPEAFVYHPPLARLRDLVAKTRRVVGGNVQRGRGERADSIGGLVRDGRRELRDIGARWRQFQAAPPPGSRQAAAMGALIVFLQMVRVAERVRLFLGGEPCRR